MEHLLWSTINPLTQRTRGAWFSCNPSFIKLTPTIEIPSDRLTVLPLALLQREAKGALRIGVELFGSMERMGNLRINLEDTVLAFRIDEWNKVLGFSFRDDQYCESISEQIELSLTANSQLPCKSDEFFQYISHEVNSSILSLQQVFTLLTGYLTIKRLLINFLPY